MGITSGSRCTRSYTSVHLDMKLWDPHFHMWDISNNTQSGHDPRQLFAPEGNPIYSLQCYEKDLSETGFNLAGGACVEATSVCHVEQDGEPFYSACVAEASWISRQLTQSSLDYLIVASAPLEDPELPQILNELTGHSKVRGIRQILNYEPSWPRNARLGDLLENKKWLRGYSFLGEFDLSFDLQLNPHQIQSAAQFISKYPGIPVIIDHLGSPTMDDLQHGYVYWNGLKALADSDHVSIKISMLSYPDNNWHQNSLIKDTVLEVIDLFGVDRCFFASNSPVENLSGWHAARLYDEFHNLISHLNKSDQQNLFADNAMRVYRVKA